MSIARLRRAILARRGGRRQDAVDHQEPRPSEVQRDELFIGRAHDTGEVRTRPLCIDGEISHCHVMGRTGTGKTFCIHALLMQYVRPGLPYSIIFDDGKGEGANDFGGTLLPARLSQFSREQQEAIAERIEVFKVFGGAVPKLNPLWARPGRRSLQVRAATDQIMAGLDPGSSHFGPAMLSVSLKLGELMLHFETLSIYEQVVALTSDRYLEQLVLRLPPGDLKSFFTERWSKIGAQSKEAVARRLEALLSVEELKRSLCADGMMDMRRVFHRGGILICDPVGGAPPGAAAYGRPLRAMVMRKIVDGIFGRTTRNMHPVLVACDEFYTGLHGNPGLALDLESVLALARSKKTALWLIHQAAEQLRPWPSLLPIVLQNCALGLSFAQAEASAKSLSSRFDTSEVMTAPRDPLGPSWDVRALTEPQIIRRRIKETVALPKQHFWLWDARGGSMERLIAPRIDVDTARRAADRLPASLRDKCAAGSVGSTVANADRILAIRRAHVRRVIEETAHPTPSFTLGAADVASLRADSKRAKTTTTVTPRAEGEAQRDEQPSNHPHDAPCVDELFLG